MAEHDFEEKIRGADNMQFDIGSCDVMTGGMDKNRFPFVPVKAQYAQGRAYRHHCVISHGVRCEDDTG